MSEGRPTCKRCLCPMREGVALQNRAVCSGDPLGATLSHSGPAELVTVWKCPACGYSYTKGTPASPLPASDTGEAAATEDEVRADE